MEELESLIKDRQKVTTAMRMYFDVDYRCDDHDPNVTLGLSKIRDKIDAAIEAKKKELGYE